MPRPAQHLVALAFALAALWACAAQAHDGVHRASGSGSGSGSTSLLKQWDFTLPSLDGRRFVQPSKIDGPVLVNFWGRDCPPCVAELPRLQAFARDNPSWTVLLVATDTPTEASQFLAQRGISLQSLRSGANVSALMRTAGNRHGALPFSVAMRSGIVCQTQLGEVSAAQLDQVKVECTAPR